MRVDFRKVKKGTVFKTDYFQNYKDVAFTVKEKRKSDMFGSGYGILFDGVACECCGHVCGGVVRFIDADWIREIVSY